jgi:hypothetical protein
MSLRRRAIEPSEAGPIILGDAIPVEQQLTVKRLRLGLTAFGKLAKKRRGGGPQVGAAALATAEGGTVVRT